MPRYSAQPAARSVHQRHVPTPGARSTLPADAQSYSGQRRNARTAHATSWRGGCNCTTGSTPWEWGQAQCQQPRPPPSTSPSRGTACDASPAAVMVAAAARVMVRRAVSARTRSRIHLRHLLSSPRTTSAQVATLWPPHSGIVVGQPPVNWAQIEPPVCIRGEKTLGTRRRRRCRHPRSPE